MLKKNLILAAVMLALALPALGASPAGGPQTGLTLPRVPAQVLVRREPGVPATVVEQILAGFGATILDFSATAQIDVVGIDDDGDLAAALALLAADARIDYAEPNFTTTLWATPNDLDFPQQWSKDNNGVNAPNGLGHAGADMNLVAAWDTRATAPDVIIAVIDDSLDTSHIDLIGNVMSSGRCFASPGSARPCTNGPDDPNPADGGDFHGTLVAGAAAARGNNGIGLAGAAWEASLLPLKVDLSHFAIVQAVDEAIAQGADIVNMSFGGPATSQAMSEAIDRAEAAGILIVASAGNADASNEIASHFPSNSRHPNVIAVAASDARDRIAGFSQWGATRVHLAAPGELIRTTANDNAYATVSGTSFSAPHAAGVAALIFADTAATDYRRVKAHLLYGAANGRDALGPVVPGQDPEAVPGRVATGRLDGDKALAGPPGGVLLISGIAIDDSASGNANGRLDPGETALLEITLENVWTDAAGVSATLSARDTGTLLVNDRSPVAFGDIGRDSSATAAFSVTLSNTAAGNRQLFMQLEPAAAGNGSLAARYFYLEVGSLSNGQTISQSIQRYDWDEFHAFHIDVPPGASELEISTAGSGDVDLLVRAEQSPQYLITLNAPSGTGFYYVDSQSRVSAGSGAAEQVSISNPLPGTYHAVVVNFDQQPKTYEITAAYSLPTAGTVEFSSATFEAAEGSGSATITVTRSAGVGGASVRYATVAETATAGEDFSAASGTLTWGPGENGDRSFEVSISDDAAGEPVETVRLTLSDVVGAELGARDMAVLEIIDDDTSAGRIAFARSAYTVVEGAGQLTISVTRSDGSVGPASVDFATRAGDAAGGADFTSLSGVLSWADGDSGDKELSIVIIDDDVPEPRESFAVELDNASGAALGSPAVATLSVDDDDERTAPNGSSGGGAADLLTLMLLLGLSFNMRGWPIRATSCKSAGRARG